MSEKRENRVWVCLLLISCFAGAFAYGGAARLPWLHGGWPELVAVGVGFEETVLVLRGLCGFMEDKEEHQRTRTEASQSSFFSQRLPK